MDSGGSTTRAEVRPESTSPVGDDASAPPALLRLEGISKSFGPLQVLDGADLNVAPGERAWVGGSNGVGKTTLLRIASGLILPDAGEIELQGLNPERDRRAFQAHVGFLSAGNTGLYARLTVLDNLEFQAAIGFVPRARRSDVIEANVARFGLDELSRRRVDRLSMGQRQRVRLAMILLHSPSVLLLDEPETSLDDDGLAVLGEAVDEHTAGGGAALICSPSRSRVTLEIDSAYVIESGRLVRQ